MPALDRSSCLVKGFNQPQVNRIQHGPGQPLILAAQRVTSRQQQPQWPCAIMDCRIIASHLLTMQRRHHAIPLQQAAQESPTFALLANRIQASTQRMQTIRSLLPAPLRTSVQAGPIEDGQWCLLVSSNAVAAKLRQFVPALQAHLQSKGMPVNAIRIKVQSRSL